MKSLTVSSTQAGGYSTGLSVGRGQWQMRRRGRKNKRQITKELVFQAQELRFESAGGWQGLLGRLMKGRCDPGIYLFKNLSNCLVVPQKFKNRITL